MKSRWDVSTICFHEIDQTRVLPASDDYLDNFLCSESFTQSFFDTRFSVISSGWVTRRPLGLREVWRQVPAGQGAKACVRALRKSWPRAWGTWEPPG